MVVGDFLAPIVDEGNPSVMLELAQCTIMNFFFGILQSPIGWNTIICNPRESGIWSIWRPLDCNWTSIPHPEKKLMPLSRRDASPCHIVFYVTVETNF